MLTSAKERTAGGGLGSITQIALADLVALAFVPLDLFLKSWHD